MADQTTAFFQTLSVKMLGGRCLPNFLNLIGPTLHVANPRHALWSARKEKKQEDEAKAVIVGTGGFIELNLKLVEKTETTDWKHEVTTTITPWSQFVGLTDTCLREPTYPNDTHGECRRSTAELKYASGETVPILPGEGWRFGCVERTNDSVESHEDTGRFIVSVLQELSKR